MINFMKPPPTAIPTSNLEHLPMFALPSIWNLIISTVMFFVAVWYIRRFLDEHDIRKGMTRSVLIFVLAYMVSWITGMTVDWMQEQIEGPKSETQIPNDLAPLLKQLEQSRP